MDIVEQLLLLSFLFAVAYGVIVAQIIALNRLFHRLTGFYSRAWVLFGAAFFLTGGLRVWSMIRLPIMMTRAQTRGMLPEHLNLEQKVTIGLALLIAFLLILAFDRHRRDLLKLGI